MNYIEEKVEEFMNQTCVCAWIFGISNQHKKKDCTHYTYHQERELIRTTLAEVDRRARDGEQLRFKDAFWETFRGAGELWFPYGSDTDPEDIEQAVQEQWDDLLTNLTPQQ